MLLLGWLCCAFVLFGCYLGFVFCILFIWLIAVVTAYVICLVCFDTLLFGGIIALVFG